MGAVRIRSWGCTVVTTFNIPISYYSKGISDSNELRAGMNQSAAYCPSMSYRFKKTRINDGGILSSTYLCAPNPHKAQP